ncbi:ankyrin repeat domain-containing protein [Candidatus Babeliales bacterium]|nr:ankyrin repeat domain-containing protein [Candidatus Babeliales bacterium]
MIKKFLFLLFIGLTLVNTALPAATTPQNRPLSLNQDEALSLLLEATKYNESTYVQSYIQFLQKNDMSIDMLGKFGDNALHVAAENGHTEMVLLLLTAGANPEARNREGLTPLHCAANTKIMQLFLDRNVTIEAVDNYGKTPLHWAALRGRTECVELLLKNRSNPNALTHLKQTPLHFAAARKDGTESVQKLLTAKANPELADYNGKTALDIAMWHRHKIVIKALS